MYTSRLPLSAPCQGMPMGIGGQSSGPARHLGRGRQGMPAWALVRPARRRRTLLPKESIRLQITPVSGVLFPFHCMRTGTEGGGMHSGPSGAAVAAAQSAAAGGASQQACGAACAEDLQASSAPSSPRGGVVIVGGGPAGIAAALALAKLRRWAGITVVERSSDVTRAAPDKSFTYALDGRGLKCIRLLGLESAFLEVALPLAEVDVCNVSTRGEVSMFRRAMRTPGVTTYFLPRAELMRVLMEEVRLVNEHAPSADRKIQVLTNAKVVETERAAQRESGPVQGSGQISSVSSMAGREPASPRASTHVVDAKDSERDEARAKKALAVHVQRGVSASHGDVDQVEVLYPSLLLGCDGINSIVRTTLESWAEEDRSETTGGTRAEGGMGEKDGTRAPTFGLHKFPSPSTGLRLKVMWLPPSPPTRSGSVMGNLSYWRLDGWYKGQLTPFTLPPVKDPNIPRTVTAALRPDHPLWKLPLGDVGAWRDALEEALPQIDLNSLVEEEQWQEYASSNGISFPCPQASDGLAYILHPHGVRASAAVLLGDAAHAFPPDTGQGVNSAFLDVQALVHHLEQHDDDVAAAADAYNKDRGPEAVALAELVQICNPYQYRQVFWARVWFLGMLRVRKFLSRVLGKDWIPPPGPMLLQNVNLRYAQILSTEKVARGRINAAFGLLGLVTALIFFALA